MLKELAIYGNELLSKGEMVYPGYRVFSDSNPINWILHVGPDGTLLHEPEKVEIRKPRPHRKRSGSPGPQNLKPYLLVDEARYALGIPEPGKEQESELLHGGFVDLLKEAYETTRAPYLTPILELLEKDIDRTSLAPIIGPRDVVTFKVGDLPYPFERREMQEFWAEHISEKCSSGLYGQCSICGGHKMLTQTIPKEVFVLNQGCQITSFNLNAFCSYGKSQTLNANICMECGLMAAQTLEHLLKSRKHGTVLTRDDAKSGQPNALRNQVAVFWLSQDVTPILVDDREVNIFDVLKSPLSDRIETEVETSLNLIQKFMEVPWSAEHLASLDASVFCLAVVSANKARLVVREWVTAPVRSSLQNLMRYVEGLHIIGPRGEEARAFAINDIMETLRGSNPNIVRGLLRTAYLGYPVPSGVLESAVRRMRVVAHQSSDNFRKAREYHIIASAAKLAMTYGEKEAETLQELDINRDNPAYLCGRLLAVLEEVQQRASNFKLNVTVVERYFGAASTSPITVFPGLLRLAETAHLPKLRKKGFGSQNMKMLIQDICAQLDKQFPATLTLKEQGEFMLGFYHQRAFLEKERADRAQVRTAVQV
jgi:CRISPR-associated protein Csd1